MPALDSGTNAFYNLPPRRASPEGRIVQDTAGQHKYCLPCIRICGVGIDVAEGGPNHLCPILSGTLRNVMEGGMVCVQNGIPRG